MAPSHRSGFSFIEILIVVTIIGILSVGVFASLRFIDRARKNTTVQMLQTYQTAIDSFHSDTGAYPNTLQDLVNKPSDEKISKRWEGPYIKKVVEVDGFKNEFVYRITKGSKNPYELYSWGPNGEGSPENEWINAWNF